jgi:hypothetical protein
VRRGARAQRLWGWRGFYAAISARLYLRRFPRGRRYSAAWIDLKGDSRREPLVHGSGADWCGTGGCALLVLEQAMDTFEVVGEVSVRRLPIGLLRSASHGCRDIAVAVGGRGITSGYAAVLSFNARRYPGDPTVRPARRLPPHTKVTVIIASTSKQTSLF